MLTGTGMSTQQVLSHIQPETPPSGAGAGPIQPQTLLGFMRPCDPNTLAVKWKLIEQKRM